MIIRVDVDDVCCRLVEAWLARYNKDWSDDLSIGAITDWDFTRFVKPDCGKRIYDYLTNFQYTDVKEVPGARAGVWKLRDAGHKVIFVTSGFSFSKVEWLYNHKFLLRGHDLLHAPDVIFANDKSVIKSDIVIDDGWHNIQDLSKSVVFTRPWNTKYDAGSHRANTWADVLHIIATKIL